MPANRYAFATRSVFPTKEGDTNYTVNVQIAESGDFNTWEVVRNPDGTEADALPQPPGWVNMTTPNTWAPDVNQMDDGTYVMYFSAATLTNYSIHCVGAATSQNIMGEDLLRSLTHHFGPVTPLGM